MKNYQIFVVFLENLDFTLAAENTAWENQPRLGFWGEHRHLEENNNRNLKLTKVIIICIITMKI